MAAHFRDDILHGKDHGDTHASDNKWRHQESASFARHANVAPRMADERHGSKDLSNFLNSQRIKPPGSAGSGGKGHQPIIIAGNAYPQGLEQPQQVPATAEGHMNGHATENIKSGAQIVKCGPLLNYRRMEHDTWFGSVLVVTARIAEGEVVPQLKLMVIEEREEDPAITDGTNVNEEQTQPNGETNRIQAEETRVEGAKLYSDASNTFWRFAIEVPMQQTELRVEYKIHGLSFDLSEGKKTSKQSFFVPAISESFRIMFHSCNGFSVGTDEAAFNGPCLWKDVLRVHEKTPFHVMLGGGDQIYNDGIRVNGPLKQWTDIGIPMKRREFPFPESLRRDCDKYYVNNYIRWYSTEPFARANGQIPQLNLWDDHDIIDGFGSYTDDFMRCSVFRGIGGVAHKYYLLFQHHLAPPLSTFTTDAPQTTSTEGQGIDPRQLEDAYVLEDDKGDSSYIIGPKPGPYVAEHSRSIYARLGARIAFFGIDARTERTRRQVNYPETYEIIFSRLRQELSAAQSSPSPVKHLIVLLGIPIAYPRLTWLENIFSSPIMGPMKFLNKRFGFGGSFFNHFDGSVDLLDDLDDHYTARTHKKERFFLVQQLQALSAEFSVRVSILGGDVHLAAVGRFYSNPALQIPLSKDHRYMANIISSAIVNKPPPQAVANLLARRNKIHHLDQSTDETLLKFFDKDPGDSNKTAGSNRVTMPSRNYAIITENSASTASQINGNTPKTRGANAYDWVEIPGETKPKLTNGHSPLHRGEQEAGTTHKAANPETHGTSGDGSLDVCIRVEQDQHNPEGRTQGYGMTIPLLEYDGAAEQGSDMEGETLLHQQLPSAYRTLQPQGQGIQHGQPHLAHHTLGSQSGLDLIDHNDPVFHQDLRLQDPRLQDPNGHPFQSPNPFDRNNGHPSMHVQNTGSPHTPQQHDGGGQFGILTAGPLQHNSIGRLQQEEDLFGSPEGADQKSNGHLSSKIVPDPPNLAEWRQRLFNVDEMITLSEEEFETYFPHVDNVYSHRSTQRYKRKPFVSHYWDCRLKGRPPGTPKSDDPNKKKRKRTARERDLCDVKIKITEYFPGAMLRPDFAPDGPQQDSGQGNNFFGGGQPMPGVHQQSQFNMPMINNIPPTHPGATGQRYYTIQRVNGNGGNGKGDGVAGPHKHGLAESDRVKKNSVQRFLMKKDKEEKKTQKTYHKKASGAALATVRKHSKDNELKLFGSCFCPFVQRVWIALEFKGLQYQYIEVDPYKKPQALLDVNPRGLVPGIRHGDWGCGESTVLMEYLEDLVVGTPLLPVNNPQLRATCRLWSDHINRRIVPAFYHLLQEQDFPKQAENTKKLQEEITKLVDASDRQGPYFLGPQLSFVDVQLAPWMIRLNKVLKHYRAWPDPEPGSRWEQWMDAVENNEHVKSTTSLDELYIDSYERYAANRPNTSELADAINGGYTIP